MEESFEYAYNNAKSEAEDIYYNKEKIEELLIKAREILLENDFVESIVEDIKTSINLLTDWINGDYTDVSKNSIVSVLACLIFILDPFEILPKNKISKLGKLTVFVLILKIIKTELNRYEQFDYNEVNLDNFIEIPKN